jgi:S1-C subfamily serine protease
VYPVRGVYAISIEHNLTIFSIDSDESGWSYLNLADSDLIEVGSTVYAIGSPRALLNTISEGIVSHSNREVGWDTLIQFTAPISFGSGGSPLLNTLGQVIGVASSSFVEGQNLNLAVPINLISELEPGELVTLEKLLQRES